METQKDDTKKDIQTKTPPSEISVNTRKRRNAVTTNFPDKDYSRKTLCTII